MENPIFLIVDDNKINLMILKQFIDKNEYEIIEAQSVKEATIICDTKFPEIVLTDINLLDGTGWELVDYIKSKRELTDTIVIATSASIQVLENPETKLKNKDKGFDLYLTKPFQKDEMWQKIKEHKKRCLK